MPLPTLPFQNLAERHPGLTQENAAEYAQAATVCLSRHHSSPAEFAIHSNSRENQVSASWQSPNDRTKRAWANEEDATRDAAYALSLAAVEITLGLVAIQRAETKSGADYYVAPINDLSEDMETWIRLEIAGLDRGNLSDVKQRLRRKLAQVKLGASNLPALAAVAGFSAKLIVMHSLEETL
jgi:hypothetical protein